MTVVPDPIEQADLSAIINRLLDRAADIENIARAGVSVHQRPSDAQLLRLAAADLSRLREERDALTTLAMSFFDPSPCSFDHHGGCQNHTFLDLDPGELCPNEQLRRLPPVAPSPDPNGGEQ